MKLLITILIATINLHSQSNSVAVLNGENITLNEVKNRMLLNYYGQTLNDIIAEKLIIQEAKKRKITIDKKELDAVISQIKNRFKSEEEFKKELKKIDITEKYYYQTIENNLLIEKTIRTIYNINPTDEDAKKYYDENPQQFKIPYALKIRQIFLKTKQEADDLIIALDAGADFIKLAELKNQDDELKKIKGDRGYITKGILLPEIEKEIFATPVSKYTKPIKTGEGYSIFFIEEERKESIIKFEEVKDRIKEAIRSNLLNTYKTQLIEELRKSAKLEIK